MSNARGGGKGRGRRPGALRSLVALGLLLIPARSLADPTPPSLQTFRTEGWFQDLPFRRVLDVAAATELYSWGGCLEANPVGLLSLEACGGTSVFGLGTRAPWFLSLDVASRFLRYVDITTLPDRSVGHQVSFGPGAGVRYFTHPLIADGLNNALIGIDLMLSAEWVAWTSKYVGVTAQLDVGASFAVALLTDMYPLTPYPFLRLSLGLAF
jgi:hypothetical protein